MRLAQNLILNTRDEFGFNRRCHQEPTELKAETEYDDQNTDSTNDQSVVACPLLLAPEVLPCRRATLLRHPLNPVLPHRLDGAAPHEPHQAPPEPSREEICDPSLVHSASSYVLD